MVVWRTWLVVLSVQMCGKVGNAKERLNCKSYGICFCPFQYFFVFMCSNVFSRVVMFSFGTRSLYAYVA